MNYFRPELGQAAFGNPWASYACPDHVEALLFALARESARVHGNVTQDWGAFEREPVRLVEVAGLTWRPYYWGDEEATKELPNMSFGDVEFRWYKHMGRGVSVNVERSPAEWVAWFDRAMSALRALDRNTRSY